MLHKAATIVASAIMILASVTANAAPPFNVPPPFAGPPHGQVVTIDHGVPHSSTVPAIDGEDVLLFVRELKRSNLPPGQSRGSVLFVHGASVPIVPAFDFGYQDYSWARFLAEAGLNVFLLDLNGYGFSPRPLMTNPCNASSANQVGNLIPNPLDATCTREYDFILNTLASERDEIDSAVEFIRALRGVDRVSLVGYSQGGMRAGTYASLNPDKVEKLIIFATCCYSRFGSSNPPAQVPATGFPLNIVNYNTLVNIRWLPNATCFDQVEPGVEQLAWNDIMRFDPLGSSWGTPAWNPIASPTGGVMRVAATQFWGWNQVAAQGIPVPTLVVVGELDSLYNTNRTLFDDLGAQDKVFLGIACASHFPYWEKQRKVFHEASRDWLRQGKIKGVSYGIVSVDADGKYHKQ